ncbi:21252_t:CDS:1 [Dentiscutata erythropus]|uniref:21252_t:CDS:1 n=1 Tax=Dentiscutata erythropus TaxID=1348616 RepID=A0A9N8VN75_9GLOM|nr:21252_t:CDS:1 [Dentiscutata erythropus]
MQKDEYHHYIPRFILRNFAIDNYERIFSSNRKLFTQKQKFWKSKKKGESLQIYDRANDQLCISLIARIYGDINMYKDLNHNDAMRVEKKLSILEEKASKVVRDIIETSQMKSQIVLLRKDLADLRKFLFIMDYRKPSRRNQFADKRFDIVTGSMVENFMQEHNLQSSQEVWLQNVREIIDTPHEDVKDNTRIFVVDRMDYRLRMIDCFLAIWQAGENDEFIMTSNSFGLFEGINYDVPIQVGGFGGPRQIAFHWFYVISPKLAVVLCASGFREGVGFEALDKFLGFKHRSIFKNVSHPPPIPEYVGFKEPSKLRPESEFDKPFDFREFDNRFDWWANQSGLKKQDNDKFTFTFVKANSATVHLVNSILLNEANPDLQLSFLSLPYLYKTIVKYYKNFKDNNFMPSQDFSKMKRTLFIALNKTHKEDLNLRRNILVCGKYWNLCKFE